MAFKITLVLAISVFWVTAYTVEQEVHRKVENPKSIADTREQERPVVEYDHHPVRPRHDQEPLRIARSSENPEVHQARLLSQNLNHFDQVKIDQHNQQKQETTTEKRDRRSVDEVTVEKSKTCCPNLPLHREQCKNKEENTPEKRSRRSADNSSSSEEDDVAEHEGHNVHDDHERKVRNTHEKTKEIEDNHHPVGESKKTDEKNKERKIRETHQQVPPSILYHSTTVAEKEVGETKSTTTTAKSL